METFKLFDQDGDGKIGFEDLKTSMEAMGEELSDQDVRDILQEVDIDGDGYLNIQEFKQMMMMGEE